MYLHELLPPSLAGGIPSIADGWDNFLRDASGHDDPGSIPPAVRRSLRPQPRPTLWYVHFLLPHSPWKYLPSGRPYSVRAAPGWGSDEVWNGNQAAVDQYWQRHLLQLGYANTVLERIVARLHATGLYDRALLVVTADHGVSFRAGQKRRPALAREPPGHRVRAAVREAAAPDARARGAPSPPGTPTSCPRSPPRSAFGFPGTSTGTRCSGAALQSGTSS